LSQDILSRFHGAWELKPVRSAAGKVVGCDAELTQDVLPHGETLWATWDVLLLVSLPLSIRWQPLLAATSETLPYPEVVPAQPQPTETMSGLHLGLC
jgi:hypothetical protein